MECICRRYNNGGFPPVSPSIFAVDFSPEGFSPGFSPKFSPRLSPGFLPGFPED